MGHGSVSRYDVDKFMRHVEGSDAAVRAFAANPRRYVEEWVRVGEVSRTPPAAGGPLTVAEQEALASRDAGALYGMGAHPYLLWHFLEAVLVWTGEKTWPQLNEEYRTAVTPLGYPDFGT